MAERRVPRIRFKGFEEDWEQRKLEELVIFNPKANIPEIFEYVDLESVVGTKMISHRSESKRTAPSRAQRLAQVGDLFYQTVRPYQKNNYLFERSDGYYVFSTGYAQMRPLVSGEFLFSLIQNEEFVKIVLDKCTGTSYPAINVKDLGQITVFLPESSREQRQIGRFSQYLDTLLSLHQRKLEKLKILKKAMLEKMFPKNGEKVPEIRFSGFTEDWEQRKLGDFCEMYNGDRGINYPKESDLVPEGIPFVNAGDLQEGRVNLRDCNKITREKFNRLGGAKIQYGDILYCLRGTLGKNAYVDNFDEGTVASSLVDIRPKNIDAMYLFTILNSDIEYRQRTLNDEGAAQPNLSARNLAEFDIPIPSLKEQEAIGTFFLGLYKVLSLHQRKLEKLRQIKKSMLERMFV